VNGFAFRRWIVALTMGCGVGARAEEPPRVGAERELARERESIVRTLADEGTTHAQRDEALRRLAVLVGTGSVLPEAETLVPRLADPSHSVRFGARAAVRMMGGKAGGSLVGGLRSGDEFVRAAVIDRFVELGPKGMGAWEALGRLAADGDAAPGARVSAVVAMAAVARADFRKVEDLMAAAVTNVADNGYMRVVAVGVVQASFLPTRQRLAILDGIAGWPVGRPRAAAIEALAIATADGWHDVRERARVRMARIGDGDVRRVMIEVMDGQAVDFAAADADAALAGVRRRVGAAMKWPDADLTAALRAWLWVLTDYQERISALARWRLDEGAIRLWVFAHPGSAGEPGAWDGAAARAGGAAGVAAGADAAGPAGGEFAGVGGVPLRAERAVDVGTAVAVGGAAAADRGDVGGARPARGAGA